MATTDHHQLQLVAFRLGREEYAVAVHDVESIVKWSRPTRLPGASAYVRGLINLRGKVLSVFDLRRRFGMDPLDDESDARVLITRLHGANTGVLVDAVTEVLTVDDDALSPPPSELGGPGSGVAGICRVGDRLVIVVELAEVFDASLLEVAGSSVGSPAAESSAAESSAAETPAFETSLAEPAAGEPGPLVVAAVAGAPDATAAVSAAGLAASA